MMTSISTPVPMNELSAIHTEQSGSLRFPEVGSAALPLPVEVIEAQLPTRTIPVAMAEKLSP